MDDRNAERPPEFNRTRQFIQIVPSKTCKEQTLINKRKQMY